MIKPSFNFFLEETFLQQKGEGENRHRPALGENVLFYYYYFFLHTAFVRLMIFCINKQTVQKVIFVEIVNKTFFSLSSVSCLTGRPVVKLERDYHRHLLTFPTRFMDAESRAFL